MKTLVEAEKFTAWYDAVEDRLRVAVNMDRPEARVDFWITRRLFLSIITQLEDFIDPKGIGLEKRDIDKMIEKGSPSPQSVDTEKKAEEKSRKESEKENKESNTRKDTEVSLLKTMNISWNKKSGKVSLNLISEEYEAEANLDTASMTALLRMLLMQAPAVEWGVSSMMFGR